MRNQAFGHVPDESDRVQPAALRPVGLHAPVQAQRRKAWGEPATSSNAQRGAARAPRTSGHISAATSQRRGISLLELLAAMAAASVVMGTAMSLVHTSYQFESRSRIVRADEQTALRLARQFRADIHEARSATLSQNAAADAPLVVLVGPPGRITYRPLAQGLVRTVVAPSGPPGREDFVFSGPIAWTVAAEGSLITLSGTSSDNRR